MSKIFLRSMLLHRRLKNMIILVLLLNPADVSYRILKA